MDDNNISVEQQRYATLLSWGSRSGLALLVVSFLAYVFGLMPVHVPLEQLPNLWNLPVGDYLKQTDTPTGWNWLTMIDQGDFASLVGIAWLSGCSLICLLAIIPIYARRKDKIFVMLCVFALAVQLLAASGMLRTGGH
ncbi:MAG TPA: hypothetical protein VIH29_07360 [Gallionella sp.]